MILLKKKLRFPSNWSKHHQDFGSLWTPLNSMCFFPPHISADCCQPAPWGWLKVEEKSWFNGEPSMVFAYPCLSMKRWLCEYLFIWIQQNIDQILRIYKNLLMIAVGYDNLTMLNFSSGSYHHICKILLNPWSVCTQRQPAVCQSFKCTVRQNLVPIRHKLSPFGALHSAAVCVDTMTIFFKSSCQCIPIFGNSPLKGLRKRTAGC